MIFVTGGEYSGKSEYVKENYGADSVNAATASPEAIRSAAAIKNFHLLLEKSGDIRSEIDEILNVNPDVIIISNEVGCGVVPTERSEREYREAVGRMNCYLAKKAERVIRVVCGIGQVIK